MQPGPAHPHFPPFGCGGFCIGFLSRIHFHGPLFNYGPYAGYYPFEPYGPWTSDLRYNGPVPGSGSCGWAKGLSGHGLGWGHYSLCTLKNVFHRVNPLAHKCGSSLSLGKCGSTGGQCYTSSGSATIDATPCATPGGCPVSTTVQSDQPAGVVKAPQAVNTTAIPVQIAPAAPVETLPGVLTGKNK
ncbi:hypothetical protein [Limnoglobus roseus]|nr:hypothetical protein [Limnoglobus roseus]